MKFAESTPFKLKLLLLVVALTYHFGARTALLPWTPQTPTQTFASPPAASMLSWISVGPGRLCDLS